MPSSLWTDLMYLDTPRAWTFACGVWLASCGLFALLADLRHARREREGRARCRSRP